MQPEGSTEKQVKGNCLCSEWGVKINDFLSRYYFEKLLRMARYFAQSYRQVGCVRLLLSLMYNVSDECGYVNCELNEDLF